MMSRIQKKIIPKHLYLLFSIKFGIIPDRVYLRLTNKKLLYLKRKRRTLMQLIEYAKCSTCKKARNWLDGQKISYETRPIREEIPTV